MYIMQTHKRKIVGIHLITMKQFSNYLEPKEGESDER